MKKLLLLASLGGVLLSTSCGKSESEPETNLKLEEVIFGKWKYDKIARDLNGNNKLDEEELNDYHAYYAFITFNEDGTGSAETMLSVGSDVLTSEFEYSILNSGKLIQTIQTDGLKVSLEVEDFNKNTIIYSTPPSASETSRIFYVITKD